MFKKLVLGLAALGLVASAPAPAQPRPQVSGEVRLGGQHDNLRVYFGNRPHYKYYPRCNRWEVAVRNPYRYNRYICVPRSHYDRYWRGDRFQEPRYRHHW